MVLTSSIYSYTDPIRFFKENDPYYWEIDNLALEQLLNNQRWLKDQIEGISNEGNLTRLNFAELKPTVNGSDNVIRVKPGQFIGRVNDAYNKTPLQKINILADITGGDFRQYTNGSFPTSSFDAIVDRLHSDVAASALNMNGLAERVLQWRIATPDRHLTTIDNAFGDLPGTGGNSDIDKWPIVFTESFKKYFSQQYGSFADLQKLSSELVKMWRGVARTAVVNVADEINISVPAFDENDFQRNDPDTGSVSVIPNAQVRIDLVFIYTHPIDTSSTAINKFTAGSPQTITAPILGIVKGAGVVLKKLPSNSNPSFTNTTTNAIDADGNPQILANVADQNNSNNGFSNLNVHGSFPSPDDLMNLAPNLIESLELNDLQLIGQSILPICYVVVRKTAAVNAAGQPVLSDTDIIDIRPFFRTAELAYNERAGIAAASPSLSLANPAVGQFQLDWQLNLVYNKLLTQINNTTQELPRVVGGGTIWGGTKFGAEGAVRLAAQLLAGVQVANLPFQDAPVYPDWDIAEWWTLYPLAVNDRGQRRNDRVNLNRVGRSHVFDAGTNPTDSLDITTSERRMGSEFRNSIINAYTLHWCKKEVLIDRSAVPWMHDYTVECEFQNCIPQSTRASTSENDTHEDEAGSAGIWVEKKVDRFIIYVGWIADTPARWNQHNSTMHGKEPRSDRDTYGFSGFAVRNSDMGLAVSDNMHYDNLSAKSPNIGVCTYPSVSFKVTGYPAGHYNKTLAQYPAVSLINLK